MRRRPQGSATDGPVEAAVAPRAPCAYDRETPESRGADTSRIPEGLIHVAPRLASLAAILAGALLASCADSGRPADRPHVVLIIIDTLRGDRLGCAGFPDGVSPEIDALSRGGLHFGRTVAPCTWTRPSVGSMLTSMPPRSLGLYREVSEALPDEALTMAEILQEHGYRTLGVNANPNLNAYYNFQQGFDTYLDSRFVFPFMKAEGADEELPTVPVRSARELFDEVRRQLDEPGPAGARADAPWFVMANLLDVHEHNNPASTLLRPEFAGLYPDAPNAEYLRAVRQTSWDIGRFVQALRERPGWERTLVVVTSDHGEGLDDHPDVGKSHGHGVVLYESNAIVPLILSATPPRWAPRVSDRLAGLIDLLPTVLDAAGVPVPDQAEGRSLLAGGGSAEYVTETHYRGTEKLGLYGEEWKLFRHGGETQAGLAPMELQRTWHTADGARTDRSAANETVAEELRKRLGTWVRANPPRKPTQPDADIDVELQEQLRAVGYLDVPRGS